MNLNQINPKELIDPSFGEKNFASIKPIFERWQSFHKEIDRTIGSFNGTPTDFEQIIVQ